MIVLAVLLVILIAVGIAAVLGSNDMIGFTLLGMAAYLWLAATAVVWLAQHIKM